MKKLRPKYRVVRITPEGSTKGAPITMVSVDPEDVDSPFVLMPRKDPAAFHALISYARMCEGDLSKEIKAWLGKIAESEPIVGTQGIRNLKAAMISLVESIR